MRLTSDAEKAFANQLVSNTKKLIASTNLEVTQKLAAIQSAIRDNGKKIDELKLSQDNCIVPEMRNRIARLISLRRAATTYLRGAAKWLVAQNSERLTFNQMPRLFAEPSWTLQANGASSTRMKTSSD